MRTLIVDGNEVVNIIESTSEHNTNISGNHQHIEVVASDSEIKIGATWDGSSYTNPAEPEE